MKKATNTIITCLLGLAIFTGSAVSATQNIWMDATHIFDKDVNKLVKNVRLETKKERAKRVKAPAPEKKNYKVGDIETFWTKNIVENKFEQTKAVLKAIGKHCYVFVEEGKSLPESAFENVRKSFDENIYPNNTKNFGFEWTPGVDGDERITLLMFDIKDGFNGSGGFVGGYFFAGDEFLNSQIPPQYNIKSNEREMFYLDISPSDPTKEHYMSIVAHEFQHMIHFAHDPKEATWVNEACSQIAPYLCGFGHANQIMSYMKTPDNSLTAWSQEQMLANYGQVYLWSYYLYNRFLAGNNGRADFFKKLVDSQQNGIKGYAEALKPLGKSFSETFARFAVTNFVNDQRLGKANEYAYDKSLGRLLLPVSETVKNLPATVEGDVLFWSADGIKLDLGNAKTKVEIKLTAPMFQLSYDQYNEFALAVVQSNSRGKVDPRISWMRIDQVKDRKTQGGTLVITPDKDYDTAMIVVVGAAPEEVDENTYKKAKGIKYSISINDAGEAVSRVAAMVDSAEMIQNYAALASVDEDSNEAAMMIRLNNLEDINFELTRSIRNELENGNSNGIDKIIEKIEAGEVKSEEIRPLLKDIISVAEFQLNQNSGNAELEEKVKVLKSF
ncbi:MAG: hypothetical protein PWR01_3100 [Clostridiales bacterium]|jgi:hypothetical protein|nr:hypothetical protein [Clostridiales bacterium]MDN5282027.1 hypothetical protein [Candidatus Ozemobacter sp.]